MDLIAEIKRRENAEVFFRKMFPDNCPRDSRNFLCPWHDDTDPSLQPFHDHLFCHGSCDRAYDVFDILQQATGCTFSEAKKIFMERHNLSEEPTKRRGAREEYVYETADGEPYTKVLRLPNKKGFPQFRWDAEKKEWANGVKGLNPILYRLPKLVAAEEIWITEGEKDVHTLESLDFTATTSPMGAGKWHLVCDAGIPPTVLHGKSVVVIGDKDQPDPKTGKLEGQLHVSAIWKSLQGYAKSVTVIWSPLGKDVSDYAPTVTKEEARAKLLELVDRAAPFVPFESTGKKDRESTNHEHLGDIMNAERLAQESGHLIRYCHAFGFLYWDERRWIQDEMEMVKRAAVRCVKGLYRWALEVDEEEERQKRLKHVTKSQDANRIKAMIYLISQEPHIAVQSEVFDRDKMRLNCANGTIDLTTGDLSPHEAGNLITHLCPVTYRPQAESPRWQQFLLEIMDGDQDLVDFLQRLLGYTLTGETREQAWVFLWGKGENGKSTLLEIVRRIMGDYAVNTSPETFMEKLQPSSAQPELAMLRGARFITASEPSKGKRFDSGIIKILTGEDSITCRNLYHGPFTFKPEGKLFFSGNYRPMVNDTSHAFWRRILLLPFLRVFSDNERDNSLKDKLWAEASGILSWMVEGCLKWQAEGLKPPEKVIQAREDYRDDNDLLHEFLDENCTIGEGLTVGKSDLYAAYEGYIKDRDGSVKKAMSKQKFNENLGCRPGITSTKAGPKTARVAAWQGICLGDGTDAENVVPIKRKTCSNCGISTHACPVNETDRDPEKCPFHRGVELETM